MFTGMDALAADSNLLRRFVSSSARHWLDRKKNRGGHRRINASNTLWIKHYRRGDAAILLLNTPRGLFAGLVPWLVLFATLSFLWGNFLRKSEISHMHLSPRGAALMQFLIAIYGGYFGGGAGFLMVSALTMAGQSVHVASTTKNILAGVMNASAVLIFLFSPDLHWSQMLATASGATIGGIIGGRFLQSIDEKILPDRRDYYRRCFDDRLIY